MARGLAAALPFDEQGQVSFEDMLRDFEWRGAPTEVGEIASEDERTPWRTPTFTNEFWTARQRAAHSLHEVSYRACFKPQLPRFFIERLTEPGDLVYDPFMGRGTTLVEAALMGRVPCGCDVNPLSRVLCEPRLSPPTLAEVAARARRGGLRRARRDARGPARLLSPGHAAADRRAAAPPAANANAPARSRRRTRWVRMVAVNRLTGHSPGFFSVYTLPPNQAVSVQIAGEDQRAAGSDAAAARRRRRSFWPRAGSLLRT